MVNKPRTLDVDPSMDRNRSGCPPVSAMSMILLAIRVGSTALPACCWSMRGCRATVPAVLPVDALLLCDDGLNRLDKVQVRFRFVGKSAVFTSPVHIETFLTLHPFAGQPISDPGFVIASNLAPTLCQCHQGTKQRCHHRYPECATKDLRKGRACAGRHDCYPKDLAWVLKCEARTLYQPL